MSLEKITDYKTFANLLMEQWKNSPNLKGIVEAFMNSGNKIEDAIFEIRDLMTLENGSGITLDLIGKIWNESRNGRNDTDYKNAILLKKTQYFSGEPEAIISILKASYGASFVIYTPEYPGKYRVNTDAVITNKQLNEISMAGVGGFVASNILDQEDNFIIGQDGSYLIGIS